jgi:uncharacterized membrane protein
MEGASDMNGTTPVAIAAIAFVGTHFLLSHPLRARLVGAMGEAAFLGLYSAVAAVTLGGLVRAYLVAPTTAPWWDVGEGSWALVTVLMLAAAILLTGSLVGNPALPDPGGKGSVPDTARGVYAITRHPMLWSFAIWGGCHILIYPVAKNVVVTSAIVILSLVGAHLQDRKKAALDPVGWPAWQSRTSYWPFAAIATGRARPGGLGAPALVGGLVLWLAATWAHIPLAGWPAGIWRWIG